MNDFRDLPIPPNVHLASDQREQLRVWIADGVSHVSLSTDLEAAAVWGVLLCDVARHVARAYSDRGICSEAEALYDMNHLWRLEFDDPTDLGTTERLQAQ